jgi:hypothetical protein
VAAAARESQLKPQFGESIYVIVNKGAFAAAAVKINQFKHLNMH